MSAYLWRKLGNFPWSVGCLNEPVWLILALAARPVVRSFRGVCARHDRGYVPRARRAARAQFARDLLRVLSAENRGDGEEPVGDHQAAGAAGAQFRLGDLWRRRLDPRAHPFHHRPHPERDRSPAGRASDLRRRARAARSTTSSAAITTSASATSWRCAAIRPAGIGTAYSTHPDGYQTLGRPGRRHQEAARRYRGLGFRLSGKTSGEPDHRCRHRHARGQGRRRRNPRHHPGVLR